MRLLFLILLQSLLFYSCKKYSEDQSPAVEDKLRGGWILIEVYGNDYWGGPFYWTRPPEIAEIFFDADFNYTRKYSNPLSVFNLGKYEILTDSTFVITRPDRSKHILHYLLINDSRLILPTGRTESVIEEKFAKK